MMSHKDVLKQVSQSSKCLVQLISLVCLQLLSISLFCLQMLSICYNVDNGQGNMYLYVWLIHLVPGYNRPDVTYMYVIIYHTN